MKLYFFLALLSPLAFADEAVSRLVPSIDVEATDMELKYEIPADRDDTYDDTNFGFILRAPKDVILKPQDKPKDEQWLTAKDSFGNILEPIDVSDAYSGLDNIAAYEASWSSLPAKGTQWIDLEGHVKAMVISKKITTDPYELKLEKGAKVTIEGVTVKVASIKDSTFKKGKKEVELQFSGKNEGLFNDFILENTDDIEKNNWGSSYSVLFANGFQKREGYTATEGASHIRFRLSVNKLDDIIKVPVKLRFALSDQAGKTTKPDKILNDVVIEPVSVSIGCPDDDNSDLATDDLAIAASQNVTINLLLTAPEGVWFTQQGSRQHLTGTDSAGKKLIPADSICMLASSDDNDQAHKPGKTMLCSILHLPMPSPEAKWIDIKGKLHVETTDDESAKNAKDKPTDGTQDDNAETMSVETMVIPVDVRVQLPLR